MVLDITVLEIYNEVSSFKNVCLVSEIQSAKGIAFEEHFLQFYSLSGDVSDEFLMKLHYYCLHTVDILPLLCK